MMENSILNTVKKAVGVAPEYPAFDSEILVHLNTVLAIMTQIGVSPFHVYGYEETWSEYFGEREDLDLIKTYVGLKVRTLFDPPTVGSVAEAINNSIKELEFRINITVDPWDFDETEDNDE